MRYRKSIGTDFDVVIDEVNTMPFFTPLWAGIPTLMLIFQLAREVWWYESRFPISAIGYATEPIYLKVYRNTQVLTISESTKKDLVRLGFRAPITIVPIGIEQVPRPAASKADSPTFLYVGRLAPSKRIEHMFEALAQFRRNTGAGTLWLVGSGSQGYRQSLLKLAKRLDIDRNVIFWGTVSVPEKLLLMTQAHALLMTSAREGWGLVITEANSCGTPAIAYDTPGLRDSVRDELTGLLVDTDPSELCEAMVRLTTDRVLYVALASEAQKWSSSFSFDETAAHVAQTLAQASHQLH